MKKKLPKCVFCGNVSPGVRIEQKSTEKTINYQVRCFDCGLSGPVGYTETEATELWEKISKCK